MLSLLPTLAGWPNGLQIQVERTGPPPSASVFGPAALDGTTQGPLRLQQDANGGIQAAPTAQRLWPHPSDASDPSVFAAVLACLDDHPGGWCILAQVLQDSSLTAPPRDPVTNQVLLGKLRLRLADHLLHLLNQPPTLTRAISIADGAEPVERPGEPARLRLPGLIRAPRTPRAGLSGEVHKTESFTAQPPHRLVLTLDTGSTNPIPRFNASPGSRGSPGALPRLVRLMDKAPGASSPDATGAMAGQRSTQPGQMPSTSALQRFAPTHQDGKVAVNANTQAHFLHAPDAKASELTHCLFGDDQARSPWRFDTTLWPSHAAPASQTTPMTAASRPDLATSDTWRTRALDRQAWPGPPDYTVASPPISTDSEYQDLVTLISAEVGLMPPPPTDGSHDPGTHLAPAAKRTWQGEWDGSAERQPPRHPGPGPSQSPVSGTSSNLVRKAASDAASDAASYMRLLARTSTSTAPPSSPSGHGDTLSMDRPGEAQPVELAQALTAEGPDEQLPLHELIKEGTWTERDAATVHRLTLQVSGWPDVSFRVFTVETWRRYTVTPRSQEFTTPRSTRTIDITYHAERQRYAVGHPEKTAVHKRPRPKGKRSGENRFFDCLIAQMDKAAIQSLCGLQFRSAKARLPMSSREFAAARLRDQVALLAERHASTRSSSPR
ncbi:hypothetical protein [Roseateles amylovorans]|uniref:Uncharacterized protein n=1 Tax=Roseateles amylovorans TaxID=2978473 RepID=A0ABY6B7R8_9BURK|nr:hypothetical protein [Roseateles amylovorans]UXH80505.1 hypothetical protein N4261_11800 [Roseateles amylovorans]